ncbi:MAG: helicase HerA-like domain-containing protein, partial [Solirubrobacteraceae bacterium]
MVYRAGRARCRGGFDGRFAQAIATAYAAEGAALDLGRGVHDGAVVPEAAIRLPLRMVNRHGLIAGATGTGKTKTLQLMAEQLAAQGVPVFLADVKGDLSGMA